MPSETNQETNHFRCPTCGRQFESQADYRPHEAECAGAKQSARPIPHELTDEDKAPDREWHSVP